jgi:hypothetical protein
MFCLFLFLPRFGTRNQGEVTQSWRQLNKKDDAALKFLSGKQK